jgi:hypothetical protein
MTAHAHARKPGHPDLNQLQHLRLFSPAATIEATARGVDSPELDAQLAIIAGFLKHARDPHCLLCVRPIGLDPPSLMACLDAPASHEWPSWSARRAAIIRKPSRKSSTRSARQCRTQGARRPLSDIAPRRQARRFEPPGSAKSTAPLPFGVPQPHQEPLQFRWAAPDRLLQPDLVDLQPLRRFAKPTAGEIKGRRDFVHVEGKIVRTRYPREIRKRQKFFGSWLRPGWGLHDRRPAGASGWLRAA